MITADFDSLSQFKQLPILQELAIIALKRYDLPSECIATLINMSENATYEVKSPEGQRWALRIHRHGYHSRKAIASELAWLTNLRQSGAATTPVPVAGKDGDFIQLAAHPRMAHPRHVVLSEWESGREPSIGENLQQPFEILGEVTARMHQHSQTWKRPTWFERHTWDFETSLGESTPHWGGWRNGMGVDESKRALFGRAVELIGKRLAVYGKASHRFGLVHCDLRLANLLLDGPSVKVIDFDDCGFGWHMYDAATPVSFYEHEPQVPELLESWKLGYRKIMALSKEDEAEIPTFIMLRRLLLVAWIGSHYQTDLAQSMGLAYTEGTMGLCENYLSRFG